jgi:hypothetical protein
VAAAAWGAVAASVLMHALIQASSYPVLTISSFAPIYPLLLVFITAVFWDGANAWTGWRVKGRANPPDEPAHASQSSEPVEPRLVGDDSPYQANTDQPVRAVSIRLAYLTWLGGALALLPFIVWHRQFRELFWFADDLFLLDQLTIYPFGEWVRAMFTESFVPVFKLLWAGVVFGFDGSYLAMLTMLWLTHALITLLLGRVLRLAGLPVAATLLVQFVFALTPGNIETLGWSVQWSAMLAIGFMLLGLWWWLRQPQPAAAFSWRSHLPLALCVALSAGAFSRGVVTGGLLAIAVVLPALLSADFRAALARLPAAGLCLLPAAAVAVVIKLNASGLQQQLAGHLGDVMEFGLSYFLLNPGHDLLGGSLHPVALLAVAALKAGVILAALALARGRVFHLLLLLLAYDLGSALLVGMGRHHTGFLASMSSRYQYSSLIATLPFVAVLFARLVDLVPAGRVRTTAATAALVIVAGLCLRGWPATLTEFTGWRGTELRRLMGAPATNDPAVRVPALDFMHIERAKALQRTYHLH